MTPNEQDPQSGQERRVKRLRILKDTVANSSFVGLSHVAAARSRWIKAFWSSVLLSGIVGFGFNFYSLAARYVTYPVAESYDPTFAAFVWPDITLCNPTNPIPFWKFDDAEAVWKSLINRTHEYALALNKKGNRVKKNNQIAMNTLSPYVFSYDEYIASFVMDAVHNSESNEMALMYNDGESLNFPFAKKFKNFYFARSVPNKFPTPCLTFNPVGFGNLSERIRLSTALERVQLFIMMNQKSYKLFDAYRESPRLQIFISAPGHAIPKRRIHRANAGSDVYMQLSMHSHKRLKHRGKCLEKPYEFEVFDVMNSGTQKFIGNYYDCRMFVKQEHTVRKCGCYNPSNEMVKLPNITQPRNCYNMSLYSPKELADNWVCLKGITKEKDTRKDILDRCGRYKRKDPCEEIVYDVSQDVLPWPVDMSPSRGDFLQNLGYLMNAATNGPSETHSGWKQYLRKNCVFLHLEMQSDATPLVAEEYSYSGAQFISDVGGIVGLWLGLSIISAFELVEIVYSVCRLIR